MIEVRLSSDDLRLVREVADARLGTAKGRPRFEYRGGSDTAAEQHFRGAAAELALCRALAIGWPATVGGYREVPDVPPRWEVRWSSRPVLKVSPRDPPDRLVALVTGSAPYLRVVGYVLAGGAQRMFPLEDPGSRGAPAHFVPAYRLAPIDPGFHVRDGALLHGYAREPDGTFRCAFCREEDPW